MTLNIQLPENTIMKPEITVFGVGGAGGNATNNMIKENLEGVNFVIANTDAQALANSTAEKRIQLGQSATQGLGAGALPEVGAEAAEEAMDEIEDHLKGSNMVFITAGMGGGTGTGAAPVIARAAREMGILTVGVVTKPFHFEGPRRMKIAEEGLEALQKQVDTLIVIPNQNLFRIANEKTTFADAFKLADNVLHRGVRGVTDLMVMPGLINLDFADVKAVMCEMGKAMMGTGEAEGERRAQEAAEAAISNPLLDNVSMKGARGVLINITGGPDMTLFEVDEAANRVREEVDPAANIIFGSTYNENLEGCIRVSVVATGIDSQSFSSPEKRQPSKTAASFFGIPQKEEAPVEELEEEIEEELIIQTEEEDAPVQTTLYEDAAQKEEQSFEPAEPTIEEDYAQAVKNLNEEYKSQLAEQNAKEQLISEGANSPFIAPEPARPNNYAKNEDSGFKQGLFAAQVELESAEGGDYNDEGSDKKDQAQEGGLFRRMAKAARSLQGSDRGYKEEIDSDIAVAERDEEKAEEDEDLMDVPAFLRRKA